MSDVKTPASDHHMDHRNRLRAKISAEFNSYLLGPQRLKAFCHLRVVRGNTLTPGRPRRARAGTRSPGEQWLRARALKPRASPSLVSISPSGCGSAPKPHNMHGVPQSVQRSRWAPAPAQIDGRPHVTHRLPTTPRLRSALRPCKTRCDSPSSRHSL